MTGSLNLQRYAEARKAGRSIEEAAALAGFSMGEAELTEAAIERGEIELAANQGGARGETTMPKHDDATPAMNGDDPLVELAAETLRGDLRDSLLAWFKAQPKAWPFMAEHEQRDLADAADRFSYQIVKEACRIIAAGERPTIVAKLVEYREKEGVEAKLKLPSTGEVVAALHEACGREVLLVTTGAEEFADEAGPPAIDADQPSLAGIGDEYDEDNA